MSASEMHCLTRLVRSSRRGKPTGIQPKTVIESKYRKRPTVKRAIQGQSMGNHLLRWFHWLSCSRSRIFVYDLKDIEGSKISDLEKRVELTEEKLSSHSAQLASGSQRN